MPQCQIRVLIVPLFISTLFLLNCKSVGAEGKESLSTTAEQSAHYSSLIMTLAAKGSIDEAEKILVEAKPKCSDDPKFKESAGFLSFQKAKRITEPGKREQFFAAAEQLSCEAVKADPNSAVGYEIIGLALAVNEPDMAVGPLRRCVALDRNPEHLTNLAAILRQTTLDTKEATALVREALTLNPNYVPARVLKIALVPGPDKVKHSKLDEIPVAERDAQWWLTLGEVDYEEGLDEPALEAWDKCTQLAPYMAAPYLHISAYYAEHGKKALAIDSLKRGIVALPNNKILIRQMQRLTQNVQKYDPGTS